MRKLGEYPVFLLSPGEYQSEEEKSCNAGLLKFRNRGKKKNEWFRVFLALIHSSFTWVPTSKYRHVLVHIFKKMVAM